jgi:hypothetical protein
MPKSLIHYANDNVQITWLGCALKYGGPYGDMADNDVIRHIHSQLPENFKVSGLNPFWSYGRMTLLGLYKVAPKHRLLITLDKMLCLMRDTLVKESGRKNVKASEFAKILGPKSAPMVKAALEDGYLMEYWCRTGNLGRIGNDSKTNEFTYEFEGALLKVLAYKGLDAQMETLWQAANKPYTPPEGIARLDGEGAAQAAHAKPAASKGKGRAVLTYSPDYSTAEYLGQVIPLEPTQRMVCRVFHTAYKAERKPVTLSFGIIQERAEQMRKPGETPGQIKTLGRLFNGHPFWESAISRVVGPNGRVSKDIYRYDPTASPQAVAPAKPRKTRKVP